MATVKVNGMRCGHCVGAVTEALKSIEGIENVVIDLEKGEATFDEAKPVSKDEIAKAIRNIGFEVE